MSVLREVVSKAVGQTHDGVFKGVFGDIPVALVPTKLLLHPDWFDALDLESFEQAPGSFVDVELRQKHTDMLYRATLRDQPDTVVYVLFEHLSTRRRDVVERMYEYFAQISRFHSRSGLAGGSPAEIFGFVIYANPSRWRLAAECMGPPYRAMRVVDARWICEELRHDRSLPAIAARLALILLIHSRSGDLLAQIDENAESFRKLASDPHYRLHHFTLHLIYIQKTTEAAMAEAAIGRLEEMIPETKAIRRTLRDVQMAEGRAEGLEQGREQGRAEGAATALHNGILAILAGRDLTPTSTQVELIRACTDTDQLTQWLVRSASAASVDDVLK